MNIGITRSFESAPQSSVGERYSRLTAGLSAAAVAVAKFYPNAASTVEVDTHLRPQPVENTLPLNPVQHAALHGAVEALEA